MDDEFINNEFLVVRVGSMYLKTGTMATKDALVLVKGVDQAQRMSMSDHEGAFDIAERVGGRVMLVQQQTKVSHFTPEMVK